MSALDRPLRGFAAGRRAEFQRIGLVVVLIVVAVCLALLVPGFLSPQNITNLLRHTSILGIVALGQTVVLLVSGVDLSVGVVISLSVMTMAEFTGGTDELIPLAIVVIFVMAAGVGLANGLLVTKRSVPPFMATLGMGVLVLGARLAYTHGYPSTTIPPGIRPVGLTTFGMVPLSFVMFLLVGATLWFVLTRMSYGRRVYAIGLSPRVARLAGTYVDRVIISVYMLCSLTAALAGLILVGWIGYVDKNVGTEYTFDSIAVVIIGGTSFAGGQGGVLGTMLAALLLVLILNVVILLGVHPHVQLISKACLVLAAVFWVEWRRRRAIGSES